MSLSSVPSSSSIPVIVMNMCLWRQQIQLFNPPSNSLDSHCCLVGGETEEMSFRRGSFRPPPASRGYSHLKFKDKIIRGCFVEGSLHLNPIKAPSGDVVVCHSGTFLQRFVKIISILQVLHSTQRCYCYFDHRTIFLMSF